MITAKIYGKLTGIGEIFPLGKQILNRKAQKIRIETIPQPDSLGRINEKVNFYDIFIYGQQEIFNTWEGYKKEYPAPMVTAEVYLIGRLKYDEKQRRYNNITLRLKKLNYHYETHP